jgi:transcription termination factor Rho
VVAFGGDPVVINEVPENMSMNDGRNRGPRRPPRRGPGINHNPNAMRAPVGVPADIEVLSEADLAAEGLLTFAALANMKATELIAAAKKLGVTASQQDDLSAVIQSVLSAQAEERGQIWAEGILEIVDDGYGFIRRNGLLPSADDVYIPSPMIRRLGLRQGDTIGGVIRAPREGEKFWGMLRVEIVSGTDPESARRRPHFGDLTPIHPIELINLETVPSNLSQRLINLVNPLGKGQRALIVSPPKAGKTSLLKQIAQGVTANYPEISLMVCLIGERPEEVTDMRRSVKGEVISSTFDEPTENHTHVAEMALEIAKRRTEAGADVVVLLDSITRLARAYNLALPPSGRTLSGGIDPIALYPPKRFFGAARKLEEGGSLTIIGTCLVDTGSKMDDVIYEEFKGTGNSELVLDRKLAEKRIFPAIDVQRSGTRREELLLDEGTLKMVWTMRRMLSAVGANEGIELLLNRIAKTESNAQFLASLTKGTEGSNPS